MDGRLTILGLGVALSLALSTGCDRVCDPGATQQCLCSDGTTGVQRCDSQGDGWEECVCDGADGDGDVDVDSDVDSDGDSDADGDGDPGPCGRPPVARGTVETSVEDLDYSSTDVVARIEHKLDVDPGDGGCVAGVELTLRQGGGCELFLDFAVAPGGAFSLSDARLTADSYCPGWTDEDEGVFEYTMDNLALTFVEHVPDRGAETSCIEDEGMTFSGTVVLGDEDRTVALDLSGLRVEGDFPSEGDPALECPCRPECDGIECGLDGVCGLSCGTCALPETCDATGRCSCTPECGDRLCGPEPVCGTSCGECIEPETCSATGVCTTTPLPGDLCDGLDDNGDGLPDWDVLTDFGWTADDAEPNDTCLTAAEILNADEEAMLREGDGWVSLRPSDPAALTTYPSIHPVGEEDWYAVRADEGSHACFPWSSQCSFRATVQLELLDRAVLPDIGQAPEDYELCVVVDGCDHVGDPARELCTDGGDWNEEASSYVMGIIWGGSCGRDDSRDLRLRVSSPTGTGCGHYQLHARFDYDNTIPCP